jgi:two-component sensor histidine kinase
MYNVAPENRPYLILIEEITHRVLNDYTVAVAALNRAAGFCADPAAKVALSAAIQRFQALAATHRALLAPPTGQDLDVGTYIGEICSNLCDSILAERQTKLLLQICNASLPSERCWLLGLILAELIRNAARHGTGICGREIIVQLCREVDGVHCTVTNAGGPANPPSFGKGRRVVTALVAELGGEVRWFFARDQTAVWVRVPLAATLDSVESCNGVSN